jgi:NADH:ubiquinone oxidoreductase subunit E
MTRETAAAESARAKLLPELKEALGKNSHLSKKVMMEIAGKDGLPLHEVYAVSSFYAYLPVAPAGKNVIRVCEALPCDLKDASAVVGCVKELLGIKPGETTADGKFSLEVAGCIGACDEAPAMMINDTLYGKLTKDKIAAILKTY